MNEAKEFLKYLALSYIKLDMLPRLANICRSIKCSHLYRKGALMTQYRVSNYPAFLSVLSENNNYSHYTIQAEAA
jgi:hypothetical protein